MLQILLVQLVLRVQLAEVGCCAIVGGLRCRCTKEQLLLLLLLLLMWRVEERVGSAEEAAAGSHHLLLLLLLLVDVELSEMGRQATCCGDL